MISAIKRIALIMLALAMCGCSNDAETGSGVNDSASSESGFSVNNIESTDSESTGDNIISGNSSTSPYESDQISESGDITEQEKGLSPKTLVSVTPTPKRTAI